MPSPPGHVSKEVIAEIRCAINDGNEDLFGLTRIGKLKCEATTPPKFYREEGGNCPYQAVFNTTDGKRFCQLHAEIWAASKPPLSDPLTPFFLTQWEREDYERQRRGEAELGPLGSGDAVGSSGKP